MPEDSVRRTPKAAIVYLTRNRPERRRYLATSLALLFKSFNEKCGYPVLIFHEGDFLPSDVRDVRRELGGEAAEKIRFIRLEPEEFVPPRWATQEIVRAQQLIDRDARDIRYRTMCRWWLRHFRKYLHGYDFYMRLDDDAFLAQEARDPIAAFAGTGLDYAAPCIHVEYPANALGLDVFSERILGSSERLKALFVDCEDSARPQSTGLATFRAGLPAELRTLIDVERVRVPLMYYNNLHIARPQIWDDPELVQFFDAADEVGGIYRLRWGDAPLQTVGLAARGFALGRIGIRYSKRHERQSGPYVQTRHRTARRFFDDTRMAPHSREACSVGSMTDFPAFNEMLVERGIDDLRRLVSLDT